MTTREPGWEPDVLPGYWQRTFPLGLDPDGEGELFATLVRRGDATIALVGTGDPAGGRRDDPGAYLANNDATTFFTATDDLLLTGPTLTNVNDVRVILVE